MTKKVPFVVVLIAVCAFITTGCAPKMDMESFQKPERPAELDKLDFFIGKWVNDGCMVVEGEETEKGTGTLTYTWEAGKSVMIERGTFNAPCGNTFNSVGMWTYDPKIKKFRMCWMDDMGSIGTGTGGYCPGTKTWYMEYSSNGMMGKTTGKGTMKVVNNDKLEWTWSEYDSLGITKFMEMKGKSVRQKK